jgi:hypothetical protein
MADECYKRNRTLVWYGYFLASNMRLRTRSRNFTETIGFKVSETNLRHLGTEFSGHNKRYVYIARVRPGSIPNTASTSRAVWATLKELISARRTGYLIRGDRQFPHCYETFGRPIDGWVNMNARLERSVHTILHVSTT